MRHVFTFYVHIFTGTQSFDVNVTECPRHFFANIHTLFKLVHEEGGDSVRITRQLGAGRLRGEAYFDGVVIVHALKRVWSSVVASLAALLHQ